jgi:hypothetical protein
MKSSNLISGNKTVNIFLQYIASVGAGSKYKFVTGNTQYTCVPDRTIHVNRQKIKNAQNGKIIRITTSMIIKYKLSNIKTK